MQAREGITRARQKLGGEVGCKKRRSAVRGGGVGDGRDAAPLSSLGGAYVSGGGDYVT